jgi:glutamine amidotransferase
MKVAILDYGLGNLFSIDQACKYVGFDTIITSDEIIIGNADALILPGVGAFGDAMNYLNKSNLIDPIHSFINQGKPFLGICLGMQMLFSESEEFGNHKGLDIIKGKIIKFPSKDKQMSIVKVPQIQWNTISENTDNLWNNNILKGIPSNSFMHFVHSYYALPENKSEILSFTEYADIYYASSVIKNNVIGLQFHPEKSGNLGIKIYENWFNAIK